MTVAIMQPYFFPYLGQFQLIHAVDRFILCDDVQYIRHGWINRNRILKPVEGVCYITVPVAKHPSGTAIRNISAVPGEGWKKDILKQVQHYKKDAPHFEAVHQLLLDCFAGDQTDITRLNAHCLKTVCDYLDIDFTVEISSAMDLDYSSVDTTDSWAIEIARQLGATTYRNPPGGVELYDRQKFADKGITLEFLKPDLNAYDQHRPLFEPGLSIIDVMMFNSPPEIKTMLSEYELF